MKERWKDIRGYEGYYQVSNLGRVKSLDRDAVSRRGVSFKVKGKVLKPSATDLGYCRVGLSKNSKNITYFVHRLVAEAFISNPDDKPYVNHKNSDRTDNRKCNLEWNTASENVHHSYREGSSKKGQDHPKAKLSNKQVLVIDKLLDKGELTHLQIANKFEVNESIINSINTGRSWNYITGRREKRTIFNRVGKHHPEAKPVINCRGELFDTIREAARCYDIVAESHIGAVCRGLRNHCGKYKDGTKIKWRYYDQPKHTYRA